jgi:hypothetical protein
MCGATFALDPSALDATQFRRRSDFNTQRQFSPRAMDTAGVDQLREEFSRRSSQVAGWIQSVCLSCEIQDNAVACLRTHMLPHLV